MRFSLTVQTILALISSAFLTHVPSIAHAQNYPDIRWKTATTEHFIIHYSEEVSWTAAKVASIADEVFQNVTKIYGHAPKGRTHIVIRDDQDISNGFAVFQLNWVTLWASPSNLPLRGRKDWVREVLTHEFAHVISLQASSGAGFRVEGLRVGTVANSDTDANTDIGGTLYFPSNAYSRWWAEGTAQLDATNLGEDAWDTHRDMLLRSSILEGNELTFDEMRNIAVREDFGGEQVYNQGLAFLLYFQEKFGPNANVKLVKESARRWKFHFDQNFPGAVQMSARDLHDEWIRSLREKYTSLANQFEGKIREGTPIPLGGPVTREAEAEERQPVEGRSPAHQDRKSKDGAYIFYPRFSPDGNWFSWVTDGVVKLRFLDQPFDLTHSPQDRLEPLTLEFTGRYYDWAPDSQKVYLSKREADIFGAYSYYDTHRVDLGCIVQARKAYVETFLLARTDEARATATAEYKLARGSCDVDVQRVTSGGRTTHLAVSPDGETIAYSNAQDGHRNLMLMDADGSHPRDLIAIGGDAEATEAAWSPDGKKIAFTLFNHSQADIWIVDVNSKKTTPITLDAADDREPVFSPDGRAIFFSSDRSGIFQIYRVSADLGLASNPQQITSVLTGAFTPYYASTKNQLLYSRFSSSGLRPYVLHPDWVEASPRVAETADDSAVLNKQLEKEDHERLDGKRYFPWPRPVRLFPSIIVEDEQFKAGIALQVSDYLEKHNLTGLALFGIDQDYQVSYENRMWYPNFFGSYTAYIRNDVLSAFNDGDSLNDDPVGVLRDNIQFISAGVSQDLRTKTILKGNHKFFASYNRRFVDRRLGFPFSMGANTVTSFRLVTNDGVSVGWNFDDRPTRPDRDFTINPRDYTYASLQYSWVNTSLSSPDVSIPAPNQNYSYHEGTASLGHYFALPFEKPWWERHTYWFRLTGGYKSRDVSSLDEFYLGGRLNFRAFGQITSNTLFYGYEDFSISGETMFLASTGYTFPLWREIDRKVWAMYFDSLYATVFAEVGNAWAYGEFKNLEQNPTRNPTLGQGRAVLEDVGAEIRLRAFLFSDFNEWNSLIRVAYGLEDHAEYGFSDNDFPLRFFIGLGTNF